MNAGIKIIPNFCLWQDLLGYGKPLRENNWMLRDTALDNLYRLKGIQENIDIYEPRLEKVFALNDGIARTFDIPSINIHLILGWIQYVIYDFYLLNSEDKAHGYPGIRGVLSVGERAELLDRDITTQDKYILTSEEKKQEYKRHPVIYTPKQFQMNTAFSNAFLIEESGSKMNVAGPNLYIDERVLKQLESIINKIGFDRFGLADNDAYTDKDYLQYNYIATFNKDEKQNNFKVTASIDDNEKYEWEYFNLMLGEVIPYENKDRNIITNLYKPYKFSSALYGPSEDNLVQWCVDDIHKRSGIKISLSNGAD